MKFRIGRLGDMVRVRYHLALFYFIWSLVPHFHLLVHSHKGGDTSHVHVSYSAADIDLANRTLEALGPVALNSSDGAEFSLDGSRPSSVSAESNLASSTIAVTAFETAIKAFPENGSNHSHYWEDANLAGMLSLFLVGLLAFVNIPYFLRRHSTPNTALRGLTLARGPPTFSPA